MSIKIDHANQVFSTTDRTSPLTFDVPGGLIVPTSSSGATLAGNIVFDPNKKQLKYYNGTEWKFVGSLEGLTDKAVQRTASHFGTGTITTKKYLSASSAGAPEWRDPENDGFKRFVSGTTVAISSNLIFGAAVTFTQSVDVNNLTVKNVAVGGSADGIPRSYVDTAVANKANDIADSLNAQYSSLLNRYQVLIAAINGAPTPPPPNPPKRFSMNYNARVLGTSEHPNVLAGFALQQARAQNLNRTPAAGSTFHCTFKQKVAVVSGKSVSYVNKAKYVLFNFNGSSAIYSSQGNL